MFRFFLDGASVTRAAGVGVTSRIGTELVAVVAGLS